MRYKYVLLKTSWGIVIFLDVEAIENPVISDTDILVVDQIYLRMNNEIRLKKEIAVEFLSAGIKSLRNEIEKILKNTPVSFYVKSIEFNNADFQIEGLYCAIREWVSEYYKIKIDPVSVVYDKEQNRYVFELSNLS